MRPAGGNEPGDSFICTADWRVDPGDRFAGSDRINTMKRWLQTFGPFFALLLVIAIFAAISDNPARFLSLSNLRIVLAQTVIVAIGAIGMTIIIISGGLDLSSGSTLALTGVVCALALQAGWPPLFALAAAGAGGGVVGVVDWVGIYEFRVCPFFL